MKLASTNFGALTLSKLFKILSMWTLVIMVVSGVVVTYHNLIGKGSSFSFWKEANADDGDNVSSVSHAISEGRARSNYGNESFRERLKKRYDVFLENFGPDDTSNNANYFIYRCDGRGCGGWSDRVKGILTAYIIANLTGRTFKAEITTHGCDLLDYIVPNRVNWSLPVSLHKHFDKGDDVFKMNAVDSRTFYNRLEKIDFIAHPMKKFKFVYFKSNLDYTDGFRSSIAHPNQLSWMANLTRDKVLGAIFRRLIKLSPRLQERLDNFLRVTLPSSTDRLVCAHVRMGSNPTIPSDTEVRNTPAILPKVWDFLKPYSERSDNKIFLMSDSQDVIEEARRQPFNTSLHFIPGKIVHVERSRTAKGEDVCGSQDKVVLESFLLMNCDVLMISLSGLSRLPAYVRGSNEGLHCLVRQGVIPCKLESLKELYKLKG